MAVQTLWGMGGALYPPTPGGIWVTTGLLGLSGVILGCTPLSQQVKPLYLGVAGQRTSRLAIYG